MDTIFLFLLVAASVLSGVNPICAWLGPAFLVGGVCVLFQNFVHGVIGIVLGAACLAFGFVKVRHKKKYWY